MLKQYYYSSSPSSMNSVMSSSSASWEEKAFAEDAAGALGGGSCIWPPRSYSCSFCMREFRSAQALGGHMNVHRRDRARLKQCLHNTSSTATPALVTDHGPHHLRNHSHGFVATYPFSAPRAFISPYSSSSNSCSTAGVAGSSSWSDSKAADLLEKNIMVMGSSEDDEDQSIINLLGGDRIGDYVETDLSVGLINTVVRGTRQLAGSCGEESTCKRTLIASAMNSSAPFPFFLQSAEVNGLMAAANSMEDLDLELRLGDPTPKQHYALLLLKRLKQTGHLMNEDGAAELTLSFLEGRATRMEIALSMVESSLEKYGIPCTLNLQVDAEVALAVAKLLEKRPELQEGTTSKDNHSPSNT